jgi:hypothetical protein
VAGQMGEGSMSRRNGIYSFYVYAMVITITVLFSLAIMSYLGQWLAWKFRFAVWQIQNLEYMLGNIGTGGF